LYERPWNSSISPGASSVPAKQATQHDGVRTGGNGLGDIAGIADAAVGDHRHVGRSQRGRDVVDGGDLRHADTCDDARGADRARTDADLDAVGAGVNQRPGRVGRGDVAADHVQMREGALDPAHAVEHALRMTVRGIDHDDIDARFGQCFGTLFGTLADTDRSTDAQTAMRILGSQRMLGRLEHVLDRDQTAQRVVFTQHQHAFEPVPMHQLACDIEWNRPRAQK
jgi:hypothetical protein